MDNDIATNLEAVLKPGIDHYLTAEQLAQTSINIAQHFSNTLTEELKPREMGKLWASDIGKPCTRQLYYALNNYDGRKEPLPYHAKVKFLYGNIVEEMVITLLRSTGKYKIENEQKRYEQNINGWTVSGRIDLTLDDAVVDVKSASTRAFQRYTIEGINSSNDQFGYAHQLHWYNEQYMNEVDIGIGSGEAPYFIFVDKQLGHIQKVTPPAPVHDLDGVIISKISDLEAGLPNRPMGMLVTLPNGNVKLGTVCSYCPFKKECYPDLRTFIYAKGPEYLVEVVKLPNVAEAKT